MLDQHQRLVHELSSALKDAGWRIERKSKGVGVDLVATDQRQRCSMFRVLVADQVRSSALEGKLAIGILEASVSSLGGYGEPVIVVGASRVTDAMHTRLGIFAEKVARKTSWGIVDERGHVALHGPGLKSVRRAPRYAERSPVETNHFDPFSDLGQWCLKVLVSHRLSGSVYAPRLQMPKPTRGHVFEPLQTAMSLAASADVSVPVASRLVAHLRREHFIGAGRPVELVREEALFERWGAANAKSPVEVAARWLLRPKDTLRHLDEVLKRHEQRLGSRACLGLFAASAKLGFNLVVGVAPHLYLEKISRAALESFGLVPARPGEPIDVFVREPRFAESVFRGAHAYAGDDVPAADFVQVWLDVSHHPARGAELAKLIENRVLAPLVWRLA